MHRRGLSRRIAAVVTVAALLAAMLAIAAPAQAGPRKTLLRATNKARVMHGLPRLKLNFPVSGGALDHTRVMIRKSKLVHSNNVESLLEPYRWWTWGENVGKTTGTVRVLHRAFMDSPGHRANVLNPSFRRVGIGAKRVDGMLWATLIFYG